MRELEGLIQIISFTLSKDKLKAFAVYLPVYMPWDNIMEYGIEITGSTGTELLSGKYFTTIYEEEVSNVDIQIENYKKIHLQNFEKLVLGIVKGVLPEMEEMNSIMKFINMLESDNAIILAKSMIKDGKEGQYIILQLQSMSV